MQPYTSPPPILIVKQSSTVASRLTPSEFDTTRLSKQASPSPTTSNTTSTPSPDGIVAPEKLNPIQVISLQDTVNPAASAAPPELPVTSTLLTLN